MKTRIGIFTLAMLAMTGCASFPWNTADKTIERSQTHRQEWQTERLRMEKELFEKPTIDFSLSSSAAKALASVEPAFDSEGNEIPAIRLVYHDPRHRFSDYVEHPVWSWLPTGRDLLWGGITVYGIDRSYTTAKRQMESQERREFRFYDTQDRMIDRTFDAANAVNSVGE